MLAPSGVSTATSSLTFSGDTGAGIGSSPSNGWSTTVPVSRKNASSPAGVSRR